MAWTRRKQSIGDRVLSAAHQKKVEKSLKKKPVIEDDMADSKWEVAYKQHLNILVAEGRVREYYHNAVRLYLGPGAWYKPDFLVVLSDGTTEMHEIKGLEREAAIVRFKVAAGMYRWATWRMFTLKGSQWVETRTIREGK